MVLGFEVVFGVRNVGDEDWSKEFVILDVEIVVG